MTTLVTIKANGPNYPVRVARIERATGAVKEEMLVPSGVSLDLWTGTLDMLVIKEEFWEGEGYKLPSPVHPDDLAPAATPVDDAGENIDPALRA